MILLMAHGLRSLPCNSAWWCHSNLFIYAGSEVPFFTHKRRLVCGRSLVIQQGCDAPKVLYLLQTKNNVISPYSSLGPIDSLPFIGNVLCVYGIPMVRLHLFGIMEGGCELSYLLPAQWRRPIYACVVLEALWQPSRGAGCLWTM